MEDPPAVFVYGTLKRGQLNYSLVEPFTRSVEPARTQGVLYDVGLFPALVDGSGIVHGEIVYLEPSDLQRCLTILDGLEDYRPDRPALSTYVRRVVHVTTSAGREDRAFAYFYNCDQPTCFPVSGLIRIESGEWPGASNRAPLVDAPLAEFKRHVGSYRETVETA